jgi:predicted small lipoprotein YifL
MIKQAESVVAQEIAPNVPLRRRPRAAWCAAMLLAPMLGLLGCGQKGPLYLPGTSKAAAPAASAATPAQPQ